MIRFDPADDDTRFLVGLAVFATTRRADLTLSTCAPCFRTGATFAFRDADKAGACLKMVAAHPDYSGGLGAAVRAGHGYRSANQGEYQIGALLRPGDLWACAVFHKDGPPVVVCGGYADARKTLAELYAEGRWADPRATPLDAHFYQAALNSIPQLF